MFNWDHCMFCTCSDSVDNVESLCVACKIEFQEYTDYVEEKYK